jgi:hypothetical protein
MNTTTDPSTPATSDSRHRRWGRRPAVEPAIATDDPSRPPVSPIDMDWDDDSPLPPRRPNLFTPLSWALVAVLIGGGGFALGANVGKNNAPTSAAVSTAARPTGATPTGATPNAAGAAGGTTRTGGTTAAAGGTVGQVQLVDGNNIYIQDSQGNVIKVTPAPGATITVNKPGTPADYKPGDTVTVQGNADADGNIAAASSISSTTGGFNRGTGVATGTAATTPPTTIGSTTTNGSN